MTQDTDDRPARSRPALDLDYIRKAAQKTLGAPAAPTPPAVAPITVPLADPRVAPQAESTSTARPDDDALVLIGVRLPRGMHRQLKLHATRNDTTIQDVLKMAVGEFLDRQSRPDTSP